MTSYHLRKLYTGLRRELRKRAVQRVEELLAQTDPESGMTMQDVLLSHAAMGYEIDVDIAVQVIHPEGPEREPNQTSADVGTIQVVPN